MNYGSDSKGKLVLLWDGRNWSSETSSESKNRLLEKLALFMHICGADLQRCLEGPFRKLDIFVQRNRKILDPNEIAGSQIVVILTKTSVLTDMLQTRQQLEVRLPVLGDALWVIYDEIVRGSRFFQEMESHGSLDDLIDHAPVWTSSFIDRPFLVLTPVLTDIEHLRKKLSGLLRQDSGQVRKNSTASLRAIHEPSVPARPVSINDLPTVRPPPGSSPSSIPVSPLRSGFRPKSR